jgi:hypothetical protein
LWDNIYKNFTVSTQTIPARLRVTTKGSYGTYEDIQNVTCTMTGNVKTTWVQPDGTPRRAKAYVNINGKVCRAVSFVKPNPTSGTVCRCN